MGIEDLLNGLLSDEDNDAGGPGEGIAKMLMDMLRMDMVNEAVPHTFYDITLTEDGPVIRHQYTLKNAFIASEYHKAYDTIAYAENQEGMAAHIGPIHDDARHVDNIVLATVLLAEDRTPFRVLLSVVASEFADSDVNTTVPALLKTAAGRKTREEAGVA